ncbi:MAG: outer membrane protein assembly factor [Gemmatimonadaceae bacterium]
MALHLRRLGALRLPVWAGLIAGCALPASAAAQDRTADRDQREAPEVTDLRFEGVKSVDKSELEESIATDASHCLSALLAPVCWVSKAHFFYRREYLDRSELRRDVIRIRAFYWKRGFREARVDTAVTRTGHEKVRVTFRVAEGRPLTVAAFRLGGAEGILPQRLARQLRRKHEGQPLNLITLDSTKVRVEQELWDKGYADAVVDTIIQVAAGEPPRAVVGLAVDPRWIARVQSVAIKGNEGVSERTIRRSLRIHEGEIYRLHDVLESQRALYESNLFRRAAIIVPPQGDSLKLIEVDVMEAPARDARVAGGFNTTEFVQLDGRFTHYNFQGSARRLELRGTIGNLLASALNGHGIFRDVTEDISGDASSFMQPTWRMSTEITFPWFLASRNTLSFSAFTHRRSFPGVVVDRSVGTSATFTREVAQRAFASLDYRFEVTDVDAGDVYFCVNFGVCDLATIDALRRRQRLSPLALTGNIDRANDPLSPTTGYRTHLDLEHASAFTFSEFRYNRAFAEGSVYRRMGGRRSTLAVHGRAGWVGALSSTGTALLGSGAGTASEEILHPRKRFYAGGSQSVRGFGENQLGPKVLTIPPGELRGNVSGDPGTTPRCPLTTPIERCDPNVAGIDDEEFTPRPLGGNTLLEASVEYRFPLPLGRNWGGAAFLDGAIVGEGRQLTQAVKGDAALTPGFGIRYYSRVGAIRVDVGLNPTRAENRPVVTEVVDTVTTASGLVPRRRIVQLVDENGDPVLRRYDPLRPRGHLLDPLNRLTLHLAIGQAF